MTASDQSDDLHTGRSQSKKRRIPGACDICKRKKIRCDSGELPGNRCTHCTQLGLECTHKEVVKTLGTAKGYVESLESRLEKMDKLLTKLLPGVDLNQEVENFGEDSSPEPPTFRNDTEDPSTDDLIWKMSKFKLNPPQNRFFGKSSGFHLIQAALEHKHEFTGVPKNNVKTFQKRKEFWELPPWARFDPEADEVYEGFDFPDDDLMPSLIDIYFLQINPFLPLLHRPTFEAEVASNLHRTDPMFARVLLLVCAHGARYSSDPRVLAEGSTDSRSSGWKWFEQVDVVRKSLHKRTSLHELQMHALHVLFCQTSEISHGVWLQIGLALRLAQDVGAHRRRKDIRVPDTEDELWKRAFWVILSLDRWSGSFSGRPSGLHDEDFDLDLPLECDDEYWETGFEQPAGKPSTIAYFNCYLSLMNILSSAMRLIYPIKRPNRVFGHLPHRSDEQTVAELDSAMNHWMDSIPDHLRWNPNCTNQLFLKQSAALHAIYYHLQIFIHKPFIPTPRNPFPVTFPSLAICTNAARSCCHVLESFSRLSALPLSQLQITAFTSTVILLLNIWSGKRSGIAPYPRREVEDVQRCMGVLKASEGRWASAGRLWDILSELASAGDVSIRNNDYAAVSNKKRPREDHNAPPTSIPSSPDEPRSIAGSRRVSSVPQSSKPVQPEQGMNFSLPMYSNELGRLPIYGQFNFSDSVFHPGDERICLNEHVPVPIPDTPSSATSSSTINDFRQFEPGMNLPSNLPTSNFFTDPYPADTEVNGNVQFSIPTTTDSVDFSSLFATNPPDSGNVSYFGDSLPMMDNETLTMWSMAPTSLELDEWGRYISSVEQMTQSHGRFSLA